MKKCLLAACLFVWAVNARASRADTTVYHSSMAGGISFSKTAAPDPFFTAWPQFPGGINHFYSYLSGNLHYPVTAIKNKIQGRVIVSVIVEKDGTISNAKIERSVSDELDKEALRLVKLSPKWTPGTINGEAVRVERTLPINFLAWDKVSY